MILDFALAFFATIGFSVIFNVPRKEIFYCGIAGASGWFLFQLIYSYGTVEAVFAATLIISYISRFLSFKRKMPATLYMIPGIIPLVPGTGIYYTMYFIVIGDNPQALMRGIETLMIAGVIAIGLLIVLSLPRWLFTTANAN